MVLDTAACLDTAPGRALRAMLVDPAPALLAPGLLWVEVGRVLRANVADGALFRAAAEAALADFLDLDVDETQVRPLLLRAWQLRDLTVVDGIFVALAEATGQALLATDLRLATAARNHATATVITHPDA
jgi:predicted nucleic acid-binding protein